MKIFSISIGLLSIITLFIGISNMDKVSLFGVGVLVWAISPYLLAVFILNNSRDKFIIKLISLSSILIAIFGLGTLIYSMYIQHDAQNALSFIVIPFYQIGLLLLIYLPLYFMYKNRSKDFK